MRGGGRGVIKMNIQRKQQFAMCRKSLTKMDLSNVHVDMYVTLPHM